MKSETKDARDEAGGLFGHHRGDVTKQGNDETEAEMIR